MSDLRKPILEQCREGMRGFDLNQTLTTRLCKGFVEHGFEFAIRYVRRDQHHDYDLTFQEVTDILDSGLGLMIVQHVAPEGWRPSEALGRLYGQTAGAETRLLRVPDGTMVWLDLEGVDALNPHEDTIKFCNYWHDAVVRAGFLPGIYIGWRCGLTSVELYKRLKFRHYWASYNLNKDEEPIVRGIQLRQRPARKEDVLPGIAQDGFDVDLVIKDQLGGLPSIVRSYR